MLTVSRRGFLVLGGTGATGAVLAACGQAEDPRDEGRDGELLGAALAAELAVESSAQAAADAGTGSAEQLALTKAILVQSSERATQLGSLAEDADAPESETTETGEDGSLDALVAAAIAAYREASGLLSTTELRATASGYLAAAAAELAALRSAQGDDPAPEAFVTGGETPPHQAADETESADAENTGSSSDETTTTTEEDE